jgi:hypothetical protein
MEEVYRIIYNHHILNFTLFLIQIQIHEILHISYSCDKILRIKLLIYIIC